MAFGRANVAKVPADWVKRLAASERRVQKQAATVEKLAATVQKLAATVDRQLSEIDAARTAQAARTLDDHHANAAAIDTLNRRQAGLDEGLVALGIEHRTSTEQLRGVLADEARHAAEADARRVAVENELSAAVARLEDALEDVRRQHDERAQQLIDGIDRERHDRLDAAQQWAVILDRVEAAAAANQATSSERSRSLEDRARLVETALETTTVRLDDLDTSREDLVERLEHLNTSIITSIDLVIDRIEPLGQAISTVVRLDESVAVMGDRITAAELLLNQRDDLELQLDRAEEFERLVAEIDPDRYATREALEELRLLVTQNVMDDHDA